MRAGAMETPPLTWDSIPGREDGALPLFEAALLVARDEYPRLDPALYEAIVESHVTHLRAQVDGLEHPASKMQAINRHLFEELGYAGNRDEYDDPRNSYINEVLERRLGNPISLALVQMEVSRRLGVPLEGVSFPGHFLVRLPVEDGVLVMDPFNRGRPLDAAELRHRAGVYMDGVEPDDDTLLRILQPASHRAILARVLRNLHGAYCKAGDWERATRCADRLLKLDPGDAGALRDRGHGYLQVGHLAAAREDLALYLARHPDAEDAAQVREWLVVTGLARARIH